MHCAVFEQNLVSSVDSAPLSGIWKNSGSLMHFLTGGFISILFMKPHIFMGQVSKINHYKYIHDVSSVLHNVAS